MTGSHYDDISMFDFNDNYPFSPPPEPGPSCVPHTCQVFEVEPDRELDKEGEGEEEPEQGEDTYIWFWLDVGSEGEGDDEDAMTKSGLLQVVTYRIHLIFTFPVSYVSDTWTICHQSCTDQSGPDT